MPLERPESYRQSLVAAFDSCPRRALYSLLDARRTPSPLAARGTLFHRWHHQAIELMRANGEERFPVEAGMELLVDVLAQKDVPPEEVVPLTMREMRWLRVLVVKWCEVFRLTVSRLVDVERRLYADLRLPTGETVTITGQLDILLAGPEADGATSVDAKTGYAKPKQPRLDPDLPAEAQDGTEKGLTELGWVQSLIYAFLVFANYPAVHRFTFREWHVFWQVHRQVTIERWEVERLTDVLAAQVSLLHAAIQEGPDSPRWVPSAGPHCALCACPRDCPIRDQVGIPVDEEEARIFAQEWIVAGEVRKERAPILKGWVEEHGPIEVPYSRGRRVVGWDLSPDGKRNFGVYEPPAILEGDDEIESLSEAAREGGTVVG